MNKEGCLKRHELKALIYETLLAYPQGATAHTLARHLNYNHSHVRTVLNEMVRDYPEYMSYALDEHQHMVRKTYHATR